ncbi:MAG TPA: Ig domain-containing protein, partial [Bryobacteraceae bacterium]
GTGVYYVQTNNYVNDYFCGSNTIPVKFDAGSLTIQGSYTSPDGTTRCSVAAAAPDAELPSTDSSSGQSDDNGCPNGAASCPLQVNVPFVLKDAAEKKYYELVIKATGGKKPYTYEILPADPPFPLEFPKGLRYKQEGDQLLIRGVPDGNYPDDYIFLGDTFDFRVRVTDFNGDSDEQLTSISVVPPLKIRPLWRPVILDRGTEGASYFAYVYSYGGHDISYTKHWTLLAGALPPGLAMVDMATDLVFRGRLDPGSHGTYQFQVKVDDGFSYPDSALIVINVFPGRTHPLKITTSTLPMVIEGAQVNFSVAASGGTGSYTWSAVSNPPPGLSLSASGALTGTATKAADAAYTFSVRVRDSAGATDTVSVDMRVDPRVGSPLHFNSTAAIPTGYAGYPFTASIQPLGGTPPYKITLDKSSPSMPSGLRLTDQGLLTGVPENAESTNLIFLVTDSKGRTSTATLALQVSGKKPPAISALDPESVRVNSAGFTLHVNGNGFPPAAVVEWNGSALQTSGGDASLVAMVPADLLTIAGAAQVTVRGSSGLEIGPVPLTILSNQPSTLTAPVAGANLGDTVEFEWLRCICSEYRLQVGDNGSGTANIFDKTLGSTAGSATVTGLQVDGRSINVRLGSHMQDGWHYQDAVFTTVRSGITSRAALTVTLKFTNSLVYPVDITVNGTLIGAVKGSSTAQQTVTITPPLLVSIEMERALTSSGRPVGDEFKGIYSPIASPASTETFVINNQIGSQLYFVPLITNTTAQGRALGVNMGLEAENRCNCVIPAHSSNVGTGYYRLYTNSNVRLYDTATPYAGSYVYWGSPDGTAANSFVSAVEAKTGILRLTLK